MFKQLNRLVYGPTPEEKIQKWNQRLKQEQRVLDREVRNLDQATAKARQSLKQLAAKGDVKSAKLLAREVVRTNKQKDRLTMAKARLGSIQMAMGHQLAMVKVTGAFSKSTEIMKASNELVKLPQLSATMREMSMEMMKSGIMEEMMEDAMEMDEDEEMEEEADAEVDKVLYELTDGKLGMVGSVKTDLPVTQEEEAADIATEAEMARMQKELQDLLTG